MIEITIPHFLEEIKISNSRRAKVFKEKDKDKVPQKYLSEPERYIWRKKILYDTVEKQNVIRNSRSVGTPRYQAISGNAMYSSQMHEQTRAKIMSALKESFVQYMPERLELKLPILIDIDLYTTPKYCNWDLSNMWIYNKAFEDVMVDQGLLPDDSIQYVTKPGAPRFIPVRKEEERRMVFKLYSDTDERVISHVMYNLEPKFMIESQSKWDDPIFKDRLKVVLTTKNKTGHVSIDMNSRVIEVNIGKQKIVWGAVSKALGKVFSQCIQNNISEVAMSKSLYDSLEDIVETELLNKGIWVITVDNGS